MYLPALVGLNLSILCTEKPDLQNCILSSFVVMSVAILSSPLFNSSPFNT